MDPIATSLNNANNISSTQSYAKGNTSIIDRIKSNVQNAMREIKKTYNAIGFSGVLSRLSLFVLLPAMGYIAYGTVGVLVVLTISVAIFVLLSWMSSSQVDAIKQHQQEKQQELHKIFSKIGNAKFMELIDKSQSSDDLKENAKIIKRNLKEIHKEIQDLSTTDLKDSHDPFISY